MSGAEAVTAIQLVDACIGIAKTIIDVGRAVSDAQGLPPKLRDLVENLPAIEELLESAHDNFEEGKVAEHNSKRVQPILKQCEQALGDLRDIFKKACPKEGDNRSKRIWKGAKTVFSGRDSQVKKLLETVFDNLKLLEQKEIYVIGGKLDKLQELTEALSRDDSGKYAHSGQGNIIANEGGNPTNYVQGGKTNRQINNPRVYNEGPSVHTHYDVPPDLTPAFFKTSDYESYKGINPERVPNTCNWFLNHANFIKWRDSNKHDLLWLSADPGCGKSVLSRALIDEELLGPKSATVSHFFFKENEEQNNIVTALCALLHRLFSAHSGLLQKYAISAVKKCGQALKNEFEGLWQILISAASDPSTGPVLCVLDALDECRDPDRSNLISNLKNFLEKTGRGSKLKFLVTSRPYDDIEYGFQTLTRYFPTIRLAGEEESAQISHEVGIVIETKLKEIAEARRLNETVRLSLQRRLCKIPNRTYLWLHLTLDEIQNALGKTESKLHKVIDTLPKTVEEAYEKILVRCDQREARKILQIIVAAQRPLRLGEIDMALEIKPKPGSFADSELDLEGDGRKEYIRKACGLFVSIVDNRVFLIHQTAREFLIRKASEVSRQSGWRHSIFLQKAHQALSEICITYLLREEIRGYPLLDDHDFYSAKIRHRDIDDDHDFYFTKIRRRDIDKREHDHKLRNHAPTHGFLEYAACYWVKHVQEAHVDSQDWVWKAAVLCDIGNGSSCTWFKVSPIYEGHILAKRSALYWTAVLGLTSEARYLIDRLPAAHQQQGLIQDALQAAVENTTHGSQLVAHFLAQKDIRVTDKIVSRAAANLRSGKQIMKLLLDQRGEDVYITKEVVTAAARNEIDGKAVLMLLLEQRGDTIADIDMITREIAESFDTEHMKNILDQRGEDVHITEEVVKAARDNHINGKAILTLLLEQRGQETRPLMNLHCHFESFSPSLSRFATSGGWCYLKA